MKYTKIVILEIQTFDTNYSIPIEVVQIIFSKSPYDKLHEFLFKQKLTLTDEMFASIF